MRLDEAATSMDALGHEVRLDLYRSLLRAGRTGMPVGEIQKRLGGMPRSTLAHHLGKLVDAGLVRQHKVRTSVISTVDFDRMDELVAYLTNECCIDETSRPDEAA
jgi:ArsR family transcriptional regulator